LIKTRNYLVSRLFFRVGKKISVNKKASIFFDNFFISKDKDGYISINTFKYIPDSEFKPTEKFINLEKQRLIRLSKADLLSELQSKYKEIKRIKDQYKYLSFHDSLTGLYSRRYFENELERLNSNFDRFKPLTIVVIDINGLKRVNDNLGHSKGDLLIKEVAKILESFVRKSDILARIGGDEFCAIFPKTKYDCVFARRKEIEKKIAKYNNDSNNELKISVPIGISTSSIQDKGNIFDLYKESDKLMYKNKQKKCKRLSSTKNLT